MHLTLHLPISFQQKKDEKPNQKFKSQNKSTNTNSPVGYQIIMCVCVCLIFRRDTQNQIYSTAYIQKFTNTNIPMN